MKRSKLIKLLSAILLTGVFVAAPTAMTCYGQSKSEDPSPVKTNALALIADLEAPNTTCSPDDTICVAQIQNAKLKAAIAGLHSIVRADEVREGIVADMQKRIDVRGGIIDDLSKVDKNSQKIDTNSQQIDALGTSNVAIMMRQHQDDKETIGDLQHSLDSCRSQQKYIALGSALGSGYLGYQFGKRQQGTNPLLNFSTEPRLLIANYGTIPQGQFLLFQPRPEDRIREALKKLNQ